jgi:hypothetical protein
MVLSPWLIYHFSMCAPWEMRKVEERKEMKNKREEDK